MSAPSALLALAPLALALGTSAQAAESPPPPASQNARSAAVQNRLADWRELTEIDRAHAIAERGPAQLAADPNLAADGEAVALLARALRAAGRDDEADRLLDDARPTAATAPWIDLERARAEIERDQLEDAVRRLTAPATAGAPMLHPGYAECWLLSGRAYARLGDNQRAAPLLVRFTELAPLHTEVPSAWHMLAGAALSARDPERALAFRERAREAAMWHGYYRARRIQVRENPTEPLPRLGLAQLFLDVDELDRARTELQELLALDERFAPGWAHLGEVERKSGRTPEALAAYDRALELEDENGPWRLNRALLRLAVGRREGARADLEILLEGPGAEDPRFLIAHLRLARLLIEDGHPDLARARYERYRELGGTEPLEAPAQGD